MITTTQNPHTALLTPSLSEIPSGNADTGATGHFMSVDDMTYLGNVKPAVEPIAVQLPNGAHIWSTHTAILDIPALPIAARVAHIFPQLTSASLISIGLLCDHGCTAVYTNTQVQILDAQQNVVLTGSRSPITKLWMIPLVPTDNMARGTNTDVSRGHTMSTVIHSQTQAELVRFYHAALGSPAVSTLLAALRKGFINIPGFTVKAVRRNIPHTIATSKGHLDQTRQGQHSTHKPKLTKTKAKALKRKDKLAKAANILSSIVGGTATADEIAEMLADAFPLEKLSSSNLQSKHNSIVETTITTMIVPTYESTQQNHSDMPSRLPVRSRSGYEYLLIMFGEDPNFIHAEPMASRHSRDHTGAYRRGTSFYTEHGFKPKYERLDNETSAELEAYLRQENIAIQYVAPQQHRTNKAERAIRTFKNHWIAAHGTADPLFPLNMWDRTLEQVELTLNLLRGSAINPTISAWEQIHGPYDFNAAPIAPIGVKVIIHEKPNHRESWAPHGVEGWYLGPALRHYRCYRVLAAHTMAERVTDTVAWHPEPFIMPGSSPIAELTAAVNELTEQLADIITSPASRRTSNPDNDQQHSTIAAITSLISAIEQLIANRRSEKGGEATTGQDQRVLLQSADGISLVRAQIAQLQRVKKSATTAPSTTSADQTNSNNNAIIHTTSTSNLRAPTAISNPDISYTEYLGPAASLPRQSNRQRRATRRLTYNKHGLQSAALAMDIDTAVPPANYRAALKTPEAGKWLAAHSEEFIRLHDVWKCIKFIPATEKPRDRKAAYYNPQIKRKVDAAGKYVYRVRGTIGGDKVEYYGDKAAQTAALTTLKLLLAGMISENAEWCTVDLTDFYLNHLHSLDEPEYMWVPMDLVPSDIISKYNLLPLVVVGKVLARIDSAIYGLPQAGRISQQHLIAQLAKHGYYEAPMTPCLFLHKTNNIAFTLVVDDFGVKYKHKHELQHFLNALKEVYQYKVDMDGKRYLGMTIDIDRVNGIVALSMPGYVQQALNKYDPRRLLPECNSPMLFVQPIYGSKQTLQATVDESTAIVDPDRIRRIQQIIGAFMYYSRAVDPSMLPAVCKLSSRQSNPTIDVELAANRLLGYAKRYPAAQTVIKKCDMVLTGHSDASYLSETKARSRAGGILYLTNKIDNKVVNGSIFCMSTIIPVTVSSAAEAEYGALFMLGKEAEPLRNTLQDLGYPQPPTKIVSDNSCAVGVTNNKVKQKRSKAFDMRFHWIKDRVKQKHFEVIWEPGSTNLADFFTKAHSAKHHSEVRPFYVQDKASP